MTATDETRPDLDELRRRLSPLLPELHRRGVASVYIFGSVLRGEARPDSDVDLFVDYEAGAGLSLFDLMEFANRMSDLLGRRVDLHTRNGLHPVIRNRIEMEARQLL